MPRVRKGVALRGDNSIPPADDAGVSGQEWSHERRRIYQLLELVDVAQHRPPADLEPMLSEISSATVTSVPGAQYASVTVIDPDQGVRSLAATHQYPILLDDIQRAVGEGPCLSAAWSQHTIVIDDLTADRRWPLYRQAALQQTPVRSVLSFRLFGEGERLAAMNLYAESAHAC